MDTTEAEVLAKIEEIQLYFASRRYGFRETASRSQLEYFEAREREYDRLLVRLDQLREAARVGG